MIPDAAVEAAWEEVNNPIYGPIDRDTIMAILDAAAPHMHAACGRADFRGSIVNANETGGVLVKSPLTRTPGYQASSVRPAAIYECVETGAAGSRAQEPDGSAPTRHAPTRSSERTADAPKTMAEVIREAIRITPEHIESALRDAGYRHISSYHFDDAGEL